VESVAINGGDAEIDGTKITVKVVNAYVPDTGDNSSLVLWTVALAASIVALCAVVFVRRRREEA
ncbi:MAG: LPXTG cell wall anchor domain-containing protein, partial [Firmicutes bacterium]|nr:LPXTG cell wall anchor domain-containing protein [Bacillota bacterium]